MNEEIFDLKLKGYCCSQIIMEMGLRRLGKTNEDLIEAMAGLCDGTGSGKICGVLSAAICLLHLADSKKASMGASEDMTDWFEDAFGDTECSVLLEGNALNKVEKCPAMIDATFHELEDILEWD